MHPETDLLQCRRRTADAGSRPAREDRLPPARIGGKRTPRTLGDSGKTFTDVDDGGRRTEDGTRDNRTVEGSGPGTCTGKMFGGRNYV